MEELLRTLEPEKAVAIRKAAEAEKDNIRKDASRRLEEVKAEKEEANRRLAAAEAEKDTIRDDANRAHQDVMRELRRTMIEQQRTNTELRRTRIEQQRTYAEQETARIEQERTYAELERAKIEQERTYTELESARIKQQRTYAELEKARIKVQFTRETLQRQIANPKRLLRWKSSTSTRNPEHENLTHTFSITAGRKRGELGTPGRAEDVMLTDSNGTLRNPITKEAAPTLDDAEIMRVSLLSHQQRTSAQAIREHASRGESPLLQRCMAGGIDFRQNVKSVAKRARGPHHTSRPQQAPAVIDLTSDSPPVKKLKLQC